jgi:translation initiation factor 1
MSDSKMFEVEFRKVKYGKYITVIKTNGLPEKEKKEIARNLKRKLGAGGTVKNGEIIIQGNHKARLHLIERIIKEVVGSYNT